MKIQLWSIDKVIPYSNNTKLHPADQVKAIASSIKKFDWDQPIVVDKDGVIIKGHGRRLAAISLGLKQVPVLIRDDLNKTEVMAARLADNHVAALGNIDTEAVRREMEALQVAAEDGLKYLEDIYSKKDTEYALSDLGQVNENAFVDDIAAAVEEQGEETKKKVSNLATARVPLSKAIGFKDVGGSDEIVYSRLVAVAESKTGLKGEPAVTQFIREIVDSAISN